MAIEPIEPIEPNTDSGDGERPFDQLLALVTHPKQREFLQHYRQFKTIVNTAKAITVAATTPHDWLVEGDNPFSRAFRELKKQVDRERLEAYEGELDKRILVSPSKMSDVLLMFGLKALNPGRYRDNFQADVRLPGNIQVVLSVPGYTPRPLPPPKKELKEGVT